MTDANEDRRKAAAPNNPPQWFVDKDYLSKLDAAGWLLELKLCAQKLDDVRRRDAGEPTFAEKWEYHLGKDDASKVFRDYFAPPVVESVERCDLAALHRYYKPALLLQIWLGATDAEIIREVQAALHEARKQHPSPVKKPGPQALTASFGATQIDRWRNHKIVEIADLLD